MKWPFARDVASQVIFMDDGRILEKGTPEEVFEHTREERTQTVPVPLHAG